MGELAPYRVVKPCPDQHGQGWLPASLWGGTGKGHGTQGQGHRSSWGIGLPQIWLQAAQVVLPKIFWGAGQEKAFTEALLGIEWTGIALDWK